MDTPIDYGKDFLHTLYRERDIAKTCGYLADDVVWITPEEILHLRTAKEIREFVTAQVGADPQPYNVDVASIKSAPVSGDSNTIAYDINLIPKREQDAVNVRVSLTIHRTGDGYEIVFVGMSRKYERSDSEQMKGFMENLPGGLMVIAGFGAGSFRELFVNSYLPKKLGYSEDEFYTRSEENPFFMIPDKEQRRMTTLVNEMTVLKRPKPISMQVTLTSAAGQEFPFQVVAQAAYKDQDGTRTILYLLFNDLTEIMREQERQRRRVAGREAKKHKAEQAQDDKKLVSDARKMYEEAFRMQEQAASQIDSIDQLINAAKEAADNAEKDATEKAAAEIAAAKADAQAQVQAAQTEAQTQIASMKETTDRDVTAAKEEAAAKVKAAEDQLHALEEAKKNQDKEYEDRILKLEWEVKDARKNAEEQLAAQKKQIEAETQEQLKAASDAAAEKEKEYQNRLEQADSEAKGMKEGLLVNINRLKDQLHQQELGLQKKDVDAAIAAKEKDKSMERLCSLLAGQMNAIQSLSTAGLKETGTASRRLQAILEQISKLAGDVPGMAEDLEKIAKMDPSGRQTANEAFTLSSCLNTVRKVIRPQCRQKGIIFTCDTNGRVPDEVVGSKAGLQLAFLCILENAVNGTAQGGRISLRAEADRPVRGRSYFHFVISDTGSGIPDDTLPVLFDNPQGELSIARKVISAMGGSIQVRSNYGSGSRFEISVSMQIGKQPAQ